MEVNNIIPGEEGVSQVAGQNPVLGNAGAAVNGIIAVPPAGANVAPFGGSGGNALESHAAVQENGNFVSEEDSISIEISPLRGPGGNLPSLIEYIDSGRMEEHGNVSWEHTPWQDDAVATFERIMTNFWRESEIFEGAEGVREVVRILCSGAKKGHYIITEHSIYQFEEFLDSFWTRIKAEGNIERRKAMAEELLVLAEKAKGYFDTCSDAFETGLRIIEMGWAVIRLPQDQRTFAGIFLREYSLLGKKAHLQCL